MNDEENITCPNASDPRAAMRGHAWYVSRRFAETAIRTRLTLLCGACGATRDKHVESTAAERQSERTAVAETLNTNALHGLRAEHPTITYVGNRFGYEKSEWRATRRDKAPLTGFPHFGAVVVLATNGIEAWYQLPDGGIFLGHKDAFEGEVGPLFSRGSERTKHEAKVSTPRTRKLSARQELLNSL